MVEAVVNEFQPDYLIAPSDVLVYEMEQRDMSQRDLARRTGLTPKHIVALTSGKSRITPETAIKLERAIGMPVNYWLNLEAHYQEALARMAEEAALDANVSWLDRLPVREMTRLGWIEKCRDKRAQLRAVLRFFGIASVDQWDEVWPSLPVAYRQHKKHAISPEAISAWLRQGELEAAGLAVQAFDRDRFRAALDAIRGLTDSEPAVFIPHMQALCADAGVAVVFVPALPKTGISGATRWLSANKAIIQLSMRFKSNDHLWFSFFHEAGHVLLHGKKAVFLEAANGIDGMDPDKEDEANTFAQNELIPAKAMSGFLAAADVSQAAIQRFARSIGIAPGVVVGQLQHRNVLSYAQCNTLKCYYTWRQDAPGA